MSHDCADKQRSQVITTHARMRMTARRVSETALSAVLDYGRVAYVRGAKIYVIGRKEVESLRMTARLRDRSFGGVRLRTGGLCARGEDLCDRP